MPCFHPIRMFRSVNGPRLDTGRIPLSSKYTGGKSLNVPCGRCVGCRLERSRQWACRIMCETQMHDSNLFLTLTYRDELIYGGASHAILYPRHLELFWKRLRKWAGKRLGYYACGEYGDKFNRPHYHACLFGVDFPDKTLFKTENGCSLYSSIVLDSLWTHGNCYYGDVTFESAAYVARYIMKKRLGKSAETYEEEGVHPEFARMSRRPAIGQTWFEKFATDVFPSDILVVGQHSSKPPRYFLDLLSRMNLNMVDDVRDRRIASATDNPDGLDPKRRKAREAVKKSAINTLTRKLS